MVDIVLLNYTDFSVAVTKLLEFDVWNGSSVFATYGNIVPFV